MRGGEKMRRFLKKFSSLCLTFALSTSGFLDLSANAASEGIYDFYLTKEEIAALEGKGTNSLPAEQIEKLENINNLNERELAGLVADCHDIRSYVAKECHFPSLLRKIGEDKMADDYEEYSKKFDRQYYYKYNIGFANPDLRLEEIDDKVYERALWFFHKMKFRPAPSNRAAVAVYALIYEMSLEEAMEKLSRPLA